MAVNYKVEVDVSDAEKKLNEISTKFEDAFNAGYAYEGNNRQLRKLINDTSAYLQQLKREYQDAVATLEKRGMDVKENKYLKQLSEDIKTAESELKGLRENLKGRQAESENMFAGLAQGAQSLMGAFTAVQGAAALFGAEEKKLQEIQTKLQASMSILMGLQRMGNALQSTSQFRIKVLNKLLEKWREWNLKVAESEGIKKTAMIAGAAGIGLLITALGALIIKFSKYSETVKQAQELQMAFRNEYASSASSQLQTLAKLQSGWEALNGDVEKQQKFLNQYSSEFKSLDSSINSVTDAEKAMTSGTDAIIESIKRKARAAAYLAQVYDLLGKIANNEAKLELPKPKANVADYLLYGLTGGWMGGTSFDQYMKDTYGNMEERVKKENQNWADQIKAITESDGFKNAMQGLLDSSDKSFEKNVAARLEAARKGYESIIRLNEDRERALADAKIAAIQDESQRELAALEANHEKRLQEIEREKKDYVEKLREQAKLEFLASNPNADASDFNANWKPSPEVQAAIDKYYDELTDYEKQSYDQSRAKVLSERNKSEYDYWISYGPTEQAKKAIKQKYDDLRKQAKTSYEQMALDEKQWEEEWQLENQKRIEYLTQYGTLEEKELAITEKYAHLRAQTQDKYQKQIYDAQEKMEKFNLQKQKGGRYYNIFRDTDRMNIVQITDAIKLAEDEIKVMSENAAENADKIEALKSALENLKKAANDFSLTGVLRSIFSTDKDDANQTASLAERIQAMRTAWIEMSDDARAKAVGGWASGIANSLGKAAGYMRDVANASGDPRIGKAADELSSVAQNFSAAGQGAASGGWVGAIVAGVLDIFGQVSEGLVNAKIQEIQAAEYAKNWKDAIEDVTLEMREAEYYSPFGERAIAKAREGSRVLVDAMEQYKRKLNELNEYYKSSDYIQELYGNSSTASHKAITNLGTGMGLGSAAVVTQSRKWGGNKYSTLESLYPDLFDNNGEIIIENVKKLLEAESYLNDAANKNLREQLQQLVEIKQAYDDAMRSIDDAISDTFGQLASGITDIIWDSVMNGTDAWSEFGKVGSEVIASLGKQLIQEMVISTYLDNFRERMRAAYSLASPGSTQAEMRNIMGDIFSGLQTVLESGSAIAEEYKAWADEHGFDLTETKERTAISKAISGVSQESFDDALGRFTAIQSHTYEMNETTKTLRIQQDDLLKQTGQILLVLSGIHSDTGDIREAVAGLRSDVTLIKSNIGTMTDKGVRMLN